MMKTRATTLVCVAAILLASAVPSMGAETKKPSDLVKAVDAVIVRPISLVSIAAGSAVFALGLPIIALRKEVKPAAKELITKPIRRTFQRPLGDMDAMAD